MNLSPLRSLRSILWRSRRYRHFALILALGRPVEQDWLSRYFAPRRLTQ